MDKNSDVTQYLARYKWICIQLEKMSIQILKLSQDMELEYLKCIQINNMPRTSNVNKTTEILVIHKLVTESRIKTLFNTLIKCQTEKHEIELCLESWIGPKALKIIYLKWYAEKFFPLIAQELNCSVPSVKKQYYQAIRKIQKKLQGKD